MKYQNIKENSKNKITHKLVDIILEKKTNLCLSADVDTGEELIKLIHQVGPKICALKTHIDTISDFNEDLIQTLKELSKEYNFLLFEDRKFADIGHIAFRQFTSEPLKISTWADLVTVHVVAGSLSVEALKPALNNTGIIIVAEMSTKDTITSEEYTKKAIEIAENHSDVVVGIVSQNFRPTHPGQLMFTPGINLDSEGDSKGQVYNAPEEAFLERGIDIMIVGRGIYQSDNPADMAERYREIGWNSYLKRNF
jgi:uridine monophosphate synthetase